MTAPLSPRPHAGKGGIWRERSGGGEKGKEKKDIF